MNLLEVAVPGVMISQIAPKARETEGATVAAAEKILAHGWFGALQTVEINSPAERKNMASIVRDNGLRYTYCLARIQNDRRLNLSELNESHRCANVKAIIGELELATSAGADTVQIISGPRPADADLRGEALHALRNSLLEILTEAGKHFPLRIAVEPLDYFAHKRNTLGSFEEAATLCEQLQSEGCRFYLCLDTAHTLLNGESPEAALRRCQPFVVDYHLCNCVTSPNTPFYGDYHLPFGPPGVVDTTVAGRFLKCALDDGFLNSRQKPTLTCEVLNNQDKDPMEMIREHHAFLEQAWEVSMNMR